MLVTFLILVVNVFALDFLERNGTNSLTNAEAFISVLEAIPNQETLNNLLYSELLEMFLHAVSTALQVSKNYFASVQIELTQSFK